MRNLSPLNTVPIDEFDLIHKSKQDPAHIILEELRPVILNRYGSYKVEFDKNTLQNIESQVYTPQAKKYLRKCYSDSTNALDNLIARIKENQPNHLRSVCQFCGIDTDNTTDHYLPQSVFPEFSVNHLNLFPCCAVCNPIKNDYWISQDPNYRGIINLYTDILPTQQFLFADVRFFRTNVIIKFRIDNPNGIDPDLYQVIEYHFRRIKLLDKYNDKTGNIYQRVFNSYKGKAAYKGKPDLIQTDLLQEVQNHFNSFGRNHYEGILMEALANNNVFLNLF
jgi:5-methylcytosine-specific restriction endonuclease McrA